VRIVSA